MPIGLNSIKVFPPYALQACRRSQRGILYRIKVDSAQVCVTFTEQL
jgi:hypothetical protein